MHARLYVHLVWMTWDRAPLITPRPVLRSQPPTWAASFFGAIMQ